MHLLINSLLFMIYPLRKYSTFYKEILHLGYPIILGQLGVIIMGFLDNIMVGQHSAAELSAASFVNNMMNLTLIFGVGFSLGITPIVGVLYGQKKHQEAGGVLKNGLLLNLLVSLLLMGCMAAVYFNLERLDQPQELHSLIRPYYTISILSLPFVMVFNTFKQFYDTITDTRSSMWIMLSGNLFNLIGNYLLIYGHCGFPEWGLTGAGISTCLSRVFMAVLFFTLFHRQKKTADYREGMYKGKIALTTLTQLRRMSLPVGMQMGMETASFSLSAIMMGWIGSVALAGHQILSTVTTIGFLVYYGLGSATSIKISLYKGRKEYASIRRCAYACFHLILICVILVNTLLWLLKDRIGYLFTDSDEVARMTALLCIPTMLYQLSDGLQVTFANALRGIGDVKSMAYIAFVSYFIVSLPLGYLFGFPLQGGAVGIWFAFPFGLTFAGLLFFLRFQHKTRKTA